MCRRGAWAELTAEVTLMAANQGKVYGSYFLYINNQDAMFRVNVHPFLLCFFVKDILDKV